MLKIFCISSLLLFATTSLALADKDIRYDTFEEWNKLGYVRSVEDTGPMSMSFTVLANAQDIYQNALMLFPRSGFPIDRKSDAAETYFVTTDWKTLPVSGFGSFVSGITGVRVRIVMAAHGNGTLTELQLRTDLEVSENSAWRPDSNTELRNTVRQMAAMVLMRPIYGNYDQVNIMAQTYVKGDEPILAREDFWSKFHLSGFKPMDIPASPGVAAPPALIEPPVVSLKGQMKLKEVFASKSGLALTCAEDESQQKALIVELQDNRIVLGPMDVILAVEYAQNASATRARLQAGESELGKTITVGKTILQFGAKASQGQKAVTRSTLIQFSEGNSVKKIELLDEETKSLLVALDKAKLFCQGR